MKMNEKNKKLFIIVAMVLMVSLVVGMGAMTYSRYISSAQINDTTATAAQWGIVITASTDGLFSKDYTDDNSDTYATKVNENGVAVHATASAGNVVAPGTSGSTSIVINGITEVKARLSLDLTFDSDIHYDTYYPIQWALVEGTGAPEDGDWKASSALSDVTLDIDAGTNLNNKTYTLYWRWAFENGENNKYDTAIGAYAAGKTTLDAINSVLGPVNALNTLGEISSTLQFDLVVTVEQVQE